MSRHVTRATIQDSVGVIYTQKEADEIVAAYPDHERDARSKGVPILGSGRIYPVKESLITIDAFDIPSHWACLGGLDFGWDHPTSAVKLAHDRDSDVVHLVSAYRVKQQTPLYHANAVKPWGEEMPWSWPHDGLDSSGKQGTKPGEPLKDAYADHGLNMLPERSQFDNGSTGVEAGLMEILERMQTGRFKVFAHLNDWFDEFRLYHRKDGKVVKEYDDLMDATRYAIMDLRYAETPNTVSLMPRLGSGGDWMSS